MAVTKYIYDGDMVLQETDEAGVTQKTYTWNPQSRALLSEFDGTSTKYYEPDGLGSTDALTDQSQTVTDRWRYQAFGAAIHVAGTDATPFTWIGRHGYYNDSLTGLYLLGSGTRYYDPTTAQFLSEDPIGFDGAEANPYRYARNEPTLVIDPSGLIGIFFSGTGESENETTAQTIPYLRSIYDEKANGPARFFVVPWLVNKSTGKTSTDVDPQPLLKEAFDWLMGQVWNQPGGPTCDPKPIDIFGMSRGGVYAILFAQVIQRRQAELGLQTERPVRFLGMIDPVSTGIVNGPITYKHGRPPIGVPRVVVHSLYQYKEPKEESWPGPAPWEGLFRPRLVDLTTQEIVNAEKSESFHPDPAVGFFSNTRHQRMGQYSYSPVRASMKYWAGEAGVVWNK